ncbi:hypothetical protein [Streptomyces hirsutus]|uniref:hypothetical protein n=1 Tax=Streptomyces hirsutus TaxID=35620 RepID=UPI0033212C60
MKTWEDPVGGRFGLVVTRTEEHGATVRLPGSAFNRHDGQWRLSSCLAAVDVAGGVSTGLAAFPQWTLTADIELHRVPAPVAGPIDVVGRLVKHGRRLSLARVTLGHPGSATPMALGHVNHVMTTPPFAPAFSALPIGGVLALTGGATDDATPAEAFGLVHAEGREGRRAVRIECDDSTSNFYGVLHGAMTGVMVEEIAAREGIRVDDVAIRFLRSVAKGPATAEVVDRLTRGEREVLCIEVVGGEESAVATRVTVSGVRTEEGAAITHG